MKILLVSSGSGSRGGGEIFLDYLGKGLADRGHEVAIWIPAHPRMDELAQKVSRFAKVIRADYRSMYDYKTRTIATAFNWRTSHRIAREWEQLNPDVIHVNKQNLEDGLDLLRAADLCSVPSICTIHLTQTARYLRAKLPWLRDWIARDALGKYRGVLVAVQETRREALEKFTEGRTRTQTILNGVPIPDLNQLNGVRDAKRRELGLKDSDFLVLGLGRLVDQKRPLLFLETAQELNRRLPFAKFLWVGDGEFSFQWDQWVAREKLGDVISRVSWQSDVLPFLSAGDLLLHVAEFEGLPLAIIEAMAAGLPCAVTRDFVREVPLFNESNVLFFDDVVMFTKNLEDRATLTRVASNGRKLAENKLSLQSMTTAYERLYAEVLRE
jgi:glycosyltransferase involved in cell wall biosynthesis